MALIEELQAEIELWMAKSKIHNLNILSDKTKIPYPTLHRLTMGRVDRPNVETVLDLLKVVTTDERRAELLRRYYPNVFHAIENDRTRLEHHVPATMQSDIEKFMSDRVGFLMTQHFLSHCGISRDRVKELFGSLGLSLVSQALDMGIIQENDGVYRTTGDFSTNSLELNKLQVQHSVASFNSASAEVGCANIRTISEGVSLEGARKLSEAINEAIDKVRSIRDENPGEHVFLVNFVLQLLDPERAKAEGVQK